MSDFQDALFSKPESERSRCERIMVCPLIIATVPFAVLSLPILLLSRPCEELGCGCCHVTNGRCGCPENLHECLKNVACSPFRITRICCTGKGDISCWKYPLWPFE